VLRVGETVVAERARIERDAEGLFEGLEPELERRLRVALRLDQRPDLRAVEPALVTAEEVARALVGELAALCLGRPELRVGAPLLADGLAELLRVRRPRLRGVEPRVDVEVVAQVEETEARLALGAPLHRSERTEAADRLAGHGSALRRQRDPDPRVAAARAD